MYILYDLLTPTLMHTHEGTKASHYPNSLKEKTGSDSLRSQHCKSLFEYHKTTRHDRNAVVSLFSHTRVAEEQPDLRDNP